MSRKIGYLSNRRLLAIMATAATLALNPVVAEAAEQDPENINHESNGTFLAGSENEVVSHEEIVESQQQEGTITVSHTNDIHGRLNQNIGIAQAAEFQNQVIEADIVVDAGDTYQGLPISNHDEGKTMDQAIQMAGYDAVAVGNHEFDFGEDVALAYGSEESPLLSSNTFRKSTGEALYPASKTVQTKNGYNVALVGTTTPETETKTHPNNVKDIEFRDPIQSVIEEMDRLLADQSVEEDAFIILAHLGIDPATPEAWRGDTLAKRLDEETKYDTYQILVLDGHSHTAAPAQSFGNVLYQQTGTALDNIGVITFDPKQPGSAKGRLYSQDEVEALLDGATDEAIDQLVKAAEAQYNEDMGTVIVENNPVFLNGVREYVRSQETNMGNLITDLMVDYGQTGGFANPTDFAMINGGGIREPIAQNEPITEGDVVAVLPFGNIISQIQVNGDQIYEMFELAYSAPTTEEGYSSSDGKYTVPATDENGLPNLSAAGGFLQVSSDVKVFYDPTKEAGQRVLAVYIQNDAGDFELVPNDQSKSYYMATNDFLAQGGDGYNMLYGAREEGPSLDRVVLQGIQAGGPDLLNRYAEALPSGRINAITEEAFKELLVEDDQVQPIIPKSIRTSETDDRDDRGDRDSGPTSPQVDQKVQSSGKKQAEAGADAQAASLPQTGAGMTLMALAASSVLAGLGLATTKRR